MFDCLEGFVESTREAKLRALESDCVTRQARPQWEYYGVFNLQKIPTRPHWEQQRVLAFVDSSVKKTTIRSDYIEWLCGEFCEREEVFGFYTTYNEIIFTFKYHIDIIYTCILISRDIISLYTKLSNTCTSDIVDKIKVLIALLWTQE